MTEDEIRDFASRLNEADQAGDAKSHVEELELGGYLRVRANREACLSFAAAFLYAAVASENQSTLFDSRCKTFEWHEQFQMSAGRVITDVSLFDDWAELESTIQMARRNDRIRDRFSLIGCGLVICCVLISVAGFIAWLLGRI